MKRSKSVEGVQKKGEMIGRVKRHTVQRAVLATIAAAGILSVAMVVPGALQFLKYTPQYKRYAQKKFSVNVSLKKALKDGFVEFEDGQKGKYLRITEKGKARLAKISIAGLGKRKAMKKQRWDGKWRMVTYDISTKKKTKRDMLRHALKEYGFVCLQNSVWVYPYECQEIVTLLKAEFELGKSVLYVVADSIENDKQLRTGFGVTYH